ncbi:type IV secretion system protein [Klebsiella quasipneumoniae]|uniref:type IV secretion system protein n=1 Tax=Klebsiella quasipneumoniae TaxID=1463165 RepID=UPI001C93CCE3|nr:type IV secretion system protein [Klebsiella quasipneumoniae]MBY5246586.1 hypothetical protein [Klebsiella quasipneumoniae]
MMKYKNLFVLCALAVSARGFATGIPVLDAASLAQAIEEVSYLSQQLEVVKNQLETTKSQLTQATNLNTYVTGNSSYASLLNSDSLYNTLPSSLSGMYSSSISTSASSLGLTSDNSIIQANDNVIASSMDKLDSLYTDLRDRTTNIENLKSMLNSTTTPTQRQDLSNRLAYENLLLQNDQNQIQTAVKYAELKQQQVASKNANTFYASWMQ